MPTYERVVASGDGHQQRGVPVRSGAGLGFSSDGPRGTSSDKLMIVLASLTAVLIILTLGIGIPAIKNKPSSPTPCPPSDNIAVYRGPIKPFSFEGRWIYRSYHTSGDVNTPVANLTFATGIMDLKVDSSSGEVTGLLTGGDRNSNFELWTLTMSGSQTVRETVIGNQIIPVTEVELIGHGIDGTRSADWVYEYHGSSVSQWSNNSHPQPDTWVGSVIRRCCSPPTGLVALVASTLADETQVLERRNFFRLSNDERLEFARGIHLLRAEPSQIYTDEEHKNWTRYDDYVVIHQNYSTKAHRGPAFLPWHRLFIYKFEQEMARVLKNPKFRLPYWDWTDHMEDRRLDIFDADIIGKNGTRTNRTVQMMVNGTLTDVVMAQFVEDGSFNNFTHVIGINMTYLPHGLQRCFGCPLEPIPPGSGAHEFMDTDIPPELPMIREVTEMFAPPLYDGPPWNDATHEPPSFRNIIEGWQQVGCRLHNAVHLWVGGTFRIVPISPNDPLFWLHHAFVDKLWDVWHRKHRWDHTPDRGYMPIEEKDKPGHHISAALEPWDVRIWNVLNPSDLGYKYARGDVEGAAGL